MSGLLPTPYASRDEFRRSPEATVYVEPGCRSQKSLFESARVLDLGCGPGNYAQLYMSLGAKEVVGVDMSEANILEAKSQTRDSRCTFFLRDMYKGELDGLGKFDLIVGFWTVHFRPVDVEPEMLPRHLTGLLKPEGRFLTIAQFPSHSGRYQPFARLVYPGIAEGEPLPAERTTAPFELLDASLTPILSINCLWPKQDDVLQAFSRGGLAIERNIALDPVLDAKMPETYRRIIITYRAPKGAEPHPTRLMIFRHAKR